MESTFEESELARKLRAALELELPYQDRPAWPGRGASSRPELAQAAVLALFGITGRRDPSNPSGVFLLLTRRTETVESHKGQMAFPGGRCEPEELLEGRFEETALRETHEEVGIEARDIRVIGALPGLDTATGFWVRPFVGLLRLPIEEITPRLNAGEIAELVWVPWSILTHPATYRREVFERGSVRFMTHVYQVGENRIWGATGAMIKNLLDRLRKLS